MPEKKSEEQSASTAAFTQQFAALAQIGQQWTQTMLPLMTPLLAQAQWQQQWQPQWQPQWQQMLAQMAANNLAASQAATSDVSAVPNPAASWAQLTAWAGENTQMQALIQGWANKHAQLWQAFSQHDAAANDTPSPSVISPPPGDRRFSGAAWTSSPLHDYTRQAYLINAEFFQQIADTASPPQGMTRERLRFLIRQLIDALAPSNFAALNPEFVKMALETKGESITQGIQNLLTDLDKGRISMTDDSAFEVGKNLAISAGSVIFENDLMQLIQYAPLTDQVAKRPLVIVPPCINKYYIMDLQPDNSLVRFIVEQGHTVFLVSWRNPDAKDASLARKTWDDYLEAGPITAIRVAREICAVSQVNVLGFCVGGTLLSSALAVKKARGEDDVASLTLMTTLLDFSDPGELGCFIDEASVLLRENTIGKGGILRGQELANVFSMLRPNDLIWQYVVNNYLKGGKPVAFDLLYWNSDSTNLPGPFLAWYLRNMYLENSLRIPDKLSMCGAKVDLARVNMPHYLLATVEDHIVPWRTAYLGRKLLGGPSTFVLGASGHIAGAINPAKKNKRSYWLNPQSTSSAEEWKAGATEQAGSWWNHWAPWLAAFTDGQVAARKPGNKKFPVIEAAPGRYVKVRA